MSTPPPPDLTSPISSPLPKRTKTAHDSSESAPINGTMASSAPAASVPVTNVQDGPHLLIKKLSDKAKLPTRGSAFAAGYDLYASKEATIPARGKGLVDTDLSMAVPAGTYGRIAPRSGLAAKNFIDTGAGVIDADYRGQVKVLLFNHSDVDFVIKEHDRIAQLVLERIYTPEVMEVAELEESVRGEGGFGSTGVGKA
ncbi:hypothetical protein V498_07843 [Pseudogymnoascus sp. VKM F-4517 (FW-2822)]|nr:hypothetical protein V498_07843 [Pseudogymnoascus sp. VKM F-4517 (FW-2822)]